MSPGGAVPALVRLRDEGAVDAIGIACEPVPLLLDYIGTGVFDAVLTHSRYTLVDRSARVVLQAARDRGMLAINAAPFRGGILAGSSSHRDSYAYRPASPDTLRVVAEIGALRSLRRADGHRRPGLLDAHRPRGRDRGGRPAWRGCDGCTRSRVPTCRRRSSTSWRRCRSAQLVATVRTALDDDHADLGDALGPIVCDALTSTGHVDAASTCSSRRRRPPGCTRCGRVRRRSGSAGTVSGRTGP